MVKKTKDAKRCSPKRPHVHVTGLDRLRTRARWLLDDQEMLKAASERIRQSVSDHMREQLLHGGPPLTLEELLREATRTQIALRASGSRLEIHFTVGPLLEVGSPSGIMSPARNERAKRSRK